MKNRTKPIAVMSLALFGASHMAKDKTPAECTRICVKDDVKYARAVDKKLYTLEGHEAELYNPPARRSQSNEP